MSRLALLAIIGTTTFSGCTMCCQPYIDDYSAFGSSTPRVDRRCGRVGSPFSDPAYASHSFESMPTEAVDGTVYFEDDESSEGVVQVSYVEP